MSELNRAGFSRVRIPEGCTLKRKQFFEYTTPRHVYDIELFEQQDGTYYAIGVPRDEERWVVYGSSIVNSAEQALQILVDKIQREGVDVLFGSDTSENGGE